MLNFHPFNTQAFESKQENAFISNKETLVFLHGNSGSLFDGGPLANSLEENGSDIQFIGIDLPGHGGSDGLEEYSLLTMAKEVAKTLNKLELRSYHLLGHSLGGHVLINALNLLNTKPLSISLMGTPPIKSGTSFDELFHSLKESEVLFTNKVNNKDLECFFNVAFLSSLGTQLPKFFENFCENFLLTDNKFREKFLCSLGSGQLQDELNILNHQECPIYFLIGTNDPLVSKNWLLKCSKELNSMGINTKVIEVENASHYPHLSNPRLVNHILLELFKFLNHSLPNELSNKRETTTHPSQNA